MGDSWFDTGYKTVKEEASKSGNAFEFRLGEEETAKVRFLSEEPLSFRQHALQLDGKWPKYTCRQGLDGGCPLCKAGSNARFVGVFPVYDYRDKKVKVYVQGIRVLKVLDKLHAREGGLTGQDFEISRSGKGTDTSYNFIPLAPSDIPAEAKDKDGNVLTIDLRAQYAPKGVDELTGVANRAFGNSGNQNAGNEENKGTKSDGFSSGVGF